MKAIIEKTEIVKSWKYNGNTFSIEKVEKWDNDEDYLKEGKGEVLGYVGIINDTHYIAGKLSNPYSDMDDCKEAIDEYIEKEEEQAKDLAYMLRNAKSYN